MSSVILISTFGNPTSKNNDRLTNIYNYYTGEKLVIIPDFEHSKKKYIPKQSESSNIIAIHVISYKHNLSIRRILSHIQFAFLTYSYLRNIRFRPISIYCAMPSSLVTFLTGYYCKKKNIKFVIDVIDLWPDSLLPISKIFKVAYFFLIPWKLITIGAYKYANVIIAESEKYAQIAKSYNKKATTYPIYLGIDINYINSIIFNQELVTYSKDNPEIRICYGGQLGNSYDFNAILNSLKELKNKRINYKMIFVGDGEQRNYIEKKIQHLGLNADITGNVEYREYLKIVSSCDIGLNIFKSNTLVVHSYKFNDYVATNLFIINSLKGETARLIDQYKIGINIETEELSQSLLKICSEWSYYKLWRVNNIKFKTEKLDKNVIYSIVDQILE